MRFGVVLWLRRQTSGLYLLVVTLALLAVSLPLVYTSSVYATSTTLNAVIRDDSPAKINVTWPPDGARVDTSQFSFLVHIHNVSQLIMYVDSHYASTTAVPPGSTSYSIPVTLTQGEHTLKVVGVDPYTNTQDTSSVSVSYNPKLPPTAPKPPTDTRGGSANKEASGVIVKPPQKTTPSTPGPLKFLNSISDGGFGILRQVDIVGHQDSHGPFAMLLRFICVILGLILLLAPREVVWFGRIIHVTRQNFVRPRRVYVGIRIVGGLLLLLPFLVL